MQVAVDFLIVCQLDSDLGEGFLRIVDTATISQLFKEIKNSREVHIMVADCVDMKTIVAVLLPPKVQQALINHDVVACSRIDLRAFAVLDSESAQQKWKRSESCSFAAATCCLNFSRLKSAYSS